ncbi:MAG: PEP-CTERM sorting domain-containing protein, partial [Planctomycetota bacterium]
AGDFFDVIRYTGSCSGTFNGIDDTHAMLASGHWSLSHDVELGGGMRSVRLTYVPEPAALALLAIGALTLIGRRRHA